MRKRIKRRPCMLLKTVRFKTTKIAQIDTKLVVFPYIPYV